MASDYNHLDDVPMSIRNTLAQSPAFSIVTDNQSPKALSQTQVMSPNAPSIPLPTSAEAAAASTEMIQLRFQQMVQMQAPADLVRMLQSGQGVNADVKVLDPILWSTLHFSTPLRPNHRRHTFTTAATVCLGCGLSLNITCETYNLHWALGVTCTIEMFVTPSSTHVVLFIH